jgi:hypothetical protein
VDESAKTEMIRTSRNPGFICFNSKREGCG